MRSLAPILLAALALVLGGCTGAAPGGDDDDDGSADAAPGSADADPSEPDAAPGCAAIPDATPAWLAPMLDDVVDTLAAYPDRATAARRADARDYLVGRLIGLGYQPGLHEYGTGTNVEATLWASPGLETGRTIVFGAHYDTVAGSPGANDNATGVAMVLAVARFLAEVDCRVHNVFFVFFDQEEDGLVGSRAYAQLLTQTGADVVAVHTVDQMGWDANDDRMIELERPDAGLFALYENAVVDGGFSIPLVQTRTGSTDHVAFRERGFDAIGITEGFATGDTTPHYHEPSDAYATVDLAYLASTTSLVNHTLALAVRGDAAAARPSPGVGVRTDIAGERHTHRAAR